MFGKRRATAPAINSAAIDASFDQAIAAELSKPLAGLDPDLERETLREGLEDAQFLAETIKAEIARLQKELERTQEIIAARKAGFDLLAVAAGFDLLAVEKPFEDDDQTPKKKSIVMKHSNINA